MSAFDEFLVRRGFSANHERLRWLLVLAACHPVGKGVQSLLWMPKLLRYHLADAGWCALWAALAIASQSSATARRAGQIAVLIAAVVGLAWEWVQSARQPLDLGDVAALLVGAGAAWWLSAPGPRGPISSAATPPVE